ncbi:MAG: response regulator [Bacteroidota bacterium]
MEANEKHINPYSLKILIAEDEKNSVFFLKTLFKKYARELVFAETGEQAVEMCRKHSDLDVVLLDIKMPDMDGYTAARKIRGFNKELVIIAQTAFAMKGDREKAIEAGCNDYIAKPLKKEALLDIIKKNLTE